MLTVIAQIWDRLPLSPDITDSGDRAELDTSLVVLLLITKIWVHP